VAILNKHGKGELYFGIGNDGIILGQQVADTTIRTISQAISSHIEPRVYPVIEVVEFDGRQCICIKFSGQNAPYRAYGRAYMRVGDEDQQVSGGELERIILAKNKDALRWDKQNCQSAKLTDISSNKLRKFLKLAGLGYVSVKNSLSKLSLLANGRILNAAVLLFARKPQKFFPNAKLRCAVFAGTDSAVIIDRKEYEGDLFYLIGQAEGYIARNTYLGMRLEGLYRVDVPEIPKEATREAIINAFCHRDYHLYDSVSIAVFTDRVELRSPGLLYGGLTIARIRRGGVSERRNELIAEMLHRVHFIEKWGRGIRLILSKAPDTLFEEVGRQFVTVFKRVGKDAKTVERTTPPVKITELELKILNILAGNPKLSRTALAANLGIRLDTIKEYIKKLKDKKLLKRKGTTSAGHWQVIKRKWK